jgi:hypothetical protein
MIDHRALANSVFWREILHPGGSSRYTPISWFTSAPASFGSGFRALPVNRRVALDSKPSEPEEANPLARVGFLFGLRGKLQ